MMAPGEHASWLVENQRHLCDEIAGIKARIGGDWGEPRRPWGLAAPPALDALTATFRLTRFERDLVCLCAGVELDADLAARCGAAQGNPQRAHATFGLALAALEDAHWSALAPSSPLRRWRLVEPEGGPSLTTSALRIDERILHFLVGINMIDARLAPLFHPCQTEGAMAAAHGAHAEAIECFVRARGHGTPIVLAGDDALGQEDVASRAAEALGLVLYGLLASDLPVGPVESEGIVTLWSREAALLPGALLVRCEPGPLPSHVARLAEAMTGLLFLACREPASMRRGSRAFRVDKPPSREQPQLWRAALGPTADRLNGAVDAVAAQFRLSARTIGQVGTEVAAQIEGGAPPGPSIWGACRELSRHRLDDLAQRIESSADWDDLVLPDAEKATLRQIAAQVSHRLEVYESWGFGAKSSRGLGISVLFAGDSGTGKTMGAEVVARALSLDLYRIDLSSVVSKYIGETEKNLRRVFDEAEESGAVLLFDEADALFGKRSEVKDSHDRYANIEVGYLLQRMESYRGLAILTTNLHSAIDKAFKRRLRFVVRFPFPDPPLREEIWRRAFPRAAPTEGLDYRKLAQASLAGGSIHNISLNAAFLAAQERQPVRMRHVLRAARDEAQKSERSLSDAELRGWV
jgi:SpoVK/Ycf46/Vps4 family AAA+-type ATPase